MKHKFQTEKKPERENLDSKVLKEPQLKQKQRQELDCDSIKGIRNEGMICYLSSLIQCLRQLDYETKYALLEANKEDFDLTDYLFPDKKQPNMTALVTKLGLQPGRGNDSRIAYSKFYQAFINKKLPKEHFMISSQTIQDSWVKIFIDQQNFQVALQNAILTKLCSFSGDVIEMPINLTLWVDYHDSLYFNKKMKVPEIIYLKNLTYEIVGVIDSTEWHAIAYVYSNKQYNSCNKQREFQWFMCNDSHIQMTNYKNLYCRSSFMVLIYKLLPKVPVNDNVENDIIPDRPLTENKNVYEEKQGSSERDNISEQNIQKENENLIENTVPSVNKIMQVTDQLEIKDSFTQIEQEKEEIQEKDFRKESSLKEILKQNNLSYSQQKKTNIALQNQENTNCCSKLKCTIF